MDAVLDQSAAVDDSGLSEACSDERSGTHAEARGVLQLHSGDRMRQPEFHRIYSQLPNVRAELVGGRVYVASPVSEPHASRDSIMGGWTLTYAARVSSLKSLDNATFILSPDDELQPDTAIIVRRNGLSRINERRLREGVGELFVEVSYSSGSYDLHDKFESYRREGVREYVVVEIREARVRWFALKDGDYVERASEDGIYKSTQFPGLWLNAEAAVNEDAAGVLDTLATGMATEEFAAFARANADSEDA